MKLFFCSGEDDDSTQPLDIFENVAEKKSRSSLLLSDTTIFKRYKLKIEKLTMLKDQDEKQIKFKIENQEREIKIKKERDFEKLEL